MAGPDLHLSLMAAYGQGDNAEENPVALLCGRFANTVCVFFCLEKERSLEITVKFSWVSPGWTISNHLFYMSPSTGYEGSLLDWWVWKWCKSCDMVSIQTHTYWRFWSELWWEQCSPSPPSSKHFLKEYLFKKKMVFVISVHFQRCQNPCPGFLKLLLWWPNTLLRNLMLFFFHSFHTHLYIYE